MNAFYVFSAICSVDAYNCPCFDFDASTLVNNVGKCLQNFDWPIIVEI